MVRLRNGNTKNTDDKDIRLIIKEIFKMMSPRITYGVKPVPLKKVPFSVDSVHQSVSRIMFPLISIRHDIPVLAALSTGLRVSTALRQA